jgi:hypothetical protein
MSEEFYRVVQWIKGVFLPLNSTADVLYSSLESSQVLKMFPVFVVAHFCNFVFAKSISKLYKRLWWEMINFTGYPLAALYSFSLFSPLLTVKNP